MKLLVEAADAHVVTSPNERHQLDGPERLLLALVQRGSRLALIHATPAFEQAVVTAGCEVLALSECPRPGERAWEALEQFHPAKVILPDAGGCGVKLRPALHSIGRAAPGAEILVGFWNSSAASALMAGLAGVPLEVGGLPDAEVRSALVEEGYAPASRRVWSRKWVRRFTEDLDQALVRFCRQLNPAAGDDWVVYTGRHAVAGSHVASPRVPGLLSVVIRNHTCERLQLVDQTLFSLACQSYRPLEIILVTQSRDPEAVETLTALLERHRHVADYVYQVISRPSAEDIRGELINVGVEAAHGQYLAFLDDDDVVYPHHYRRLVEALQRGTAAWSVSRTRRARFTFDADGSLYCKKKDVLSKHEEFSLPDLIRDNYIPSHAYVLDRERLGQFRVAFSEEVNRCEDYVFLLHLAACFRPIFLADGPSCEYRIRDDGSNSNMMAEQPEEVRAREQVAWLAAQAVKESIKQPLQMLISLGEYEEQLQHARAAGREAEIAERQALPPPLRHRIVDRINGAAKVVFPLGHLGVKALTAWAGERARASRKP